MKWHITEQFSAILQSMVQTATRPQGAYAKVQGNTPRAEFFIEF